jgi:hypothetical protein
MTTALNSNTATAAEVREWLRANGFNVGKRGRIAAEHKAAFTEATGREVQ